MSLIHGVSAIAPEPPPAGKIRIKLTNSTQGAHLCQALRGHCEVDLAPGSEGTAIVIDSSPSGSRPILRRVDAWLTEFGVEKISLELNGRMYEMKKT